MGKRIALFCDGTWNSAAQRHPTNVCLLAESAARLKGVQHVHYFDGVGANVDQLLGGLFGIGLDRILLDAYEKLCADYRPGDELFLFGFSRGAYMARSLVGMMRTCGVLKREHLVRAGDALELYRRRKVAGGPDAAAAVVFRRQYAAAWHDGPPGRALAVRYMGLWETIGALGVPERVPFARIFNRRYQFHDCDLSSMVLSARHALATDETRYALVPAPWSEASIQRINELHRERRIEQIWFPGDHGSVGGGGPRAHLSAGALLWIAAGARGQGLLLKDAKGHLRRAREVFDPVNGFLKNADGDPIGLAVQGRGPRLRETPKSLDDVSEGLRRRIKERPGYAAERSLKGYWRRLTLADVLYDLENPPQPSQPAAAPAPDVRIIT